MAEIIHEGRQLASEIWLNVSHHADISHEIVDRCILQVIAMKSDYFMHKTEGPRGSIFIDDSYSATPDGVIAALKYIQEAYPNKKKILVFPGI